MAHHKHNPHTSHNSASKGDLFATGERCYHSHPPLKFKVPTTRGGEPTFDEYQIFGGSCYNPVTKDADIYIGFDSGMPTKRHFPWQAAAQGPLSICYPITDGSVPQDVADFKLMLDWLAVQLTASKKVHLGCIGGHGRTGLVLAALITVMTGEKDSISYVRKNYCERVVESKQQVDWLHEHFGITKQIASRDAVRYVEGTGVTSARGATSVRSDWYKNPTTATNGATSYKPHTFGPSKADRIVSTPTKAPINIWGNGEDAMLQFDK